MDAIQKTGDSPAPATGGRLSVNLSPEVAEALRWLTHRQGISVTEAVRRAISHEKYIYDALDREARFLLEEPGKTPRELVFMT
jgi:hypothetical protein